MTEIVAYETVTVPHEGLTLDGLIWRRFKRQKQGLLELTLAHPDNHRLADFGPMLPVGLAFTLPIERETGTPVVETISLWD